MGLPSRKYRLGYANHLIGHATGDQKAFIKPTDFSFFIGLLKSAMDFAECLLYNHALIPNHYHAECSRPKNPDALSLGMGRALKEYTDYHHEEYGSKGNLWIQRFKSYPINTDAYLLTCGAYIDLNSVRAGLVVDPAEYEWSSAGFYLRGDANPIITPNPAFLALGHSDEERRRRYRELCEMWAARGPRGEDAKKFFKTQPKSLLPDEGRLTLKRFLKGRI